MTARLPEGVARALQRQVAQQDAQFLPLVGGQAEGAGDRRIW